MPARVCSRWMRAASSTPLARSACSRNIQSRVGALRLIVREDLSAYRFSHLRHCTSAGEPLNPEVIATWKNATGHTIYEGYGQTESVAMVANIRSRGDEVRPGSMGKPTPGYEVAV